MQQENWKEIGMASINFQEHLRATLQFPELDEHQSRLLVVPLDLVISKEGVLKTVEYSRTPGRIIDIYEYTEEAAFVEPAKQVVTSFKGWVPNKIEGEYQKTKRYLTISFFYHKNTLSNQGIVLNPDRVAYYPNKTRNYEYSIEGKYGCDGMGAILAIIDKEGEPKEVECLYCVGKTNATVVEHEFLRLGKWEPALFQGEPVDSQICLTIYA